jgi:DNA-directed RNA polymerase subunit RPC12/RpoP
MESSFKCPNCGKQTFGVTPTRCSAGVICPHCSQSGLTIVMHEQKNDDIMNMGGGLFQKRNKIN